MIEACQQHFFFHEQVSAWYIGVEMLRDTTILIRLTKEEKAHFNRVALASGESISVWIRQALRAASNMNQAPVRNTTVEILEGLSKPGVDWDNVSIPATSKEVEKLYTDPSGYAGTDAISGREVVPEPPDTMIPEIPVSGQEEPPTESGHWEGKDWVPD